jgi:hypothetical protein
MNRRNKYVYVSKKFYKLSKQNICTYQTNYTNCRNKYVYMSNKFYKLLEQNICTYLRVEQTLQTTRTKKTSTPTPAWRDA